MSAEVFKFPFCCRRKMIFQPARQRWYCSACRKLMARQEPFVVPAAIDFNPVFLTEPPIV